MLPVYNGARTIARAVRSILEQSLYEIELIVVDDGSADETVAILEAECDPRLRVIHCAHRGVAAAANTGTQAAKAPIIARMDADDLAYPKRLETQLSLLCEGKFDAVGCQVRILDESHQSASSLGRYAHWINEETIDSDQIMALRFVEFPLVNPTIMAHRKYFELGFRDDDLPEDYDLMLRAASLGMRFGKVSDVLLDWTDSPNRLTRTDTRYTPDAFMRCRRSHLLAGPLGHRTRLDLWGVGHAGKPWLRWLQTQGLTVRRAYDVDDRKVGQIIHGVPILHPSEMPAADGTLLMIAVGAKDARQSILPAIVSRGYSSGADAWFVA